MQHLPLVLVCALLSVVSAFDDGSADFYAQVGDDPAADMKKVLLTDAVAATGAQCLDGTAGAYYFRAGTGSGKSKWYVHHQGGGWCESLDDCLGRSKTDLGSSKGYPASINSDGGYFSIDPAVNPLMYNWNSVFMKYCDGGSFSGNNDTVTMYKGEKLYFRGKRIREAMVASLMSDHGLQEATDLVVSGCSAGGLATFLHTDQWCDTVGKATGGKTKCVGLPDSGFFLDYQNYTAKSAYGNTIPGNYHDGLKWVFEQMNSTGGVNQDCIAAHQGAYQNPYRCQFAEHTAVFTHTPMFPLQSEYDSWQTGHVLADAAIPNVQEMGRNITSRMAANLLAPHPDSGVFLDSCHHHCGAWNSIRIDGDLVSVAMKKWYDSLGTPGAKKVWNQGKTYPCDACCKP